MNFDQQYENDGLYQTSIFPQVDSPLDNIPQFLTASMLGNQPIDPLIRGMNPPNQIPNQIQGQEIGPLSDEKELKYQSEIQQLKEKLMAQKQGFESVVRAKNQQAEQANLLSLEIQRQLKLQVFELQISIEINKNKLDAQFNDVFKEKDKKIQLLSQDCEQINQELIKQTFQNQDLINKIKSFKEEKEMIEKTQNQFDNQQSNQLSLENQKLKQVIKDSQQIIADLNQQIQNLSQTDSKKQENESKEILEMNQKLQEISEQLSQAKIEKNQLEIQLDQISKNEQNIKNIQQSSQEDVPDGNKELLQQLLNRDDQINQLKQKMQNLEETREELSQLQKLSQKQYEEINKLKQVQNELQQEIKRLRTLNSEVSLENNNLKDKVRQQEESLIQVEGQNLDRETFKQKIKQAEVANQELKKNNDEKESKIRYLNKTIEDLNSQLNKSKGAKDLTDQEGKKIQPNLADSKNYYKPANPTQSPNINQMQQVEQLGKNSNQVQKVDSQVKQYSSNKSPLKLNKQEPRKIQDKSSSETPQFPSNQPEEEQIKQYQNFNFKRQVKQKGFTEQNRISLKKNDAGQNSTNDQVVNKQEVPKKTQTPMQVKSNGLEAKTLFGAKKQEPDKQKQSKQQSFTFADKQPTLNPYGQNILITSERNKN